MLQKCNETTKLIFNISKYICFFFILKEQHDLYLAFMATILV